jgi:putative hemolysin
LRVEWAQSLADVRAAQRLRCRVFVEEGGASLASLRLAELPARYRRHFLAER